MTILCQDSRILVCLKPAGVVSVDEPGGMPALLRQALGDAHACVRTVHRLDAAAGGVMQAQQPMTDYGTRLAQRSKPSMDSKSSAASPV